MIQNAGSWYIFKAFEIVLNVTLIYTNSNLLETWRCETKIDFCHHSWFSVKFYQLISLQKIIILYQNVTFKNIFHLWNDIVFSADLIKAAQTNPPNQQLILKCQLKMKCVVKPGCSLIFLGHFIILIRSRTLNLHLRLNRNNVLSCFFYKNCNSCMFQSK